MSTVTISGLDASEGLLLPALLLPAGDGLARIVLDDARVPALAALAAVDLLQMRGCDLAIHARGRVDMAAIAILLNGRRGQRSLAASARIYLHLGRQPSPSQEPILGAMRRMEEHWADFKRIVEVIHMHSSLTLTDEHEDYPTMLNAREAIQLGLADFTTTD
jgi:ATP-dependent protease ClpP protease subunit